MREQQAGRNQAGGAGEDTSEGQGAELEKWAWTTPVEKFGMSLMEGACR